MKAAGVIGVIYGAVVVVGGVIGYLTAGSLSSLVAGGGCGVVMLIGAWAMLKGKSAGWYVALTVSAALTVFFGARFWQGGAFMPTGMMAALSVLMVGVLITASARWTRKDALPQ